MAVPDTCLDPQQVMSEITAERWSSSTTGPINPAVKAIIIHRRPRSLVEQTLRAVLLRSEAARCLYYFLFKFASGVVRFIPFRSDSLRTCEKTLIEAQKLFTDPSEV